MKPHHVLCTLLYRFEDLGMIGCKRNQITFRERINLMRVFRILEKKRVSLRTSLAGGFFLPGSLKNLSSFYLNHTGRSEFNPWKGVQIQRPFINKQFLFCSTLVSACWMSRCVSLMVSRCFGCFTLGRLRSLGFQSFMTEKTSPLGLKSMQWNPREWIWSALKLKVSVVINIPFDAIVMLVIVFRLNLLKERCSRLTSQ